MYAQEATDMTVQRGQDYQIRSSNGGEGNIDTETLKLFIPNAFTPNGDGINDEFYITATNFKSIDFIVIDRWGKQTYSAKNAEFRWNGKVNGRDIQEGIYMYLFSGVTNDDLKIKRSGTITVVR